MKAKREKLVVELLAICGFDLDQEDLPWRSLTLFHMAASEEQCLTMSGMILLSLRRPSKG